MIVGRGNRPATSAPNIVGDLIFAMSDSTTMPLTDKEKTIVDSL